MNTENNKRWKLGFHSSNLEIRIELEIEDVREELVATFGNSMNCRGCMAAVLNGEEQRRHGRDVVAILQNTENPNQALAHKSEVRIKLGSWKKEGLPRMNQGAGRRRRSKLEVFDRTELPHFRFSSKLHE